MGYVEITQQGVLLPVCQLCDDWPMAREGILGRKPHWESRRDELRPAITAWRSMPKDQRQPATLTALAEQLGISRKLATYYASGRMEKCRLRQDRCPHCGRKGMTELKVRTMLDTDDNGAETLALLEAGERKKVISPQFVIDGILRVIDKLDGRENYNAKDGQVVLRAHELLGKHIGMFGEGKSGKPTLLQDNRLQIAIQRLIPQRNGGAPEPMPNPTPAKLLNAKITIEKT